MAWPAFAAGKALVSTLIETGKISAAPRPCTARKTMSTVTDGASAHVADAKPNSATPANNARRRP